MKPPLSDQSYHISLQKIATLEERLKANEIEIDELNSQLTTQRLLSKEREEELLQYKQFFDNIPHIIWIANSYGKIEYISKSLSLYTGLSFEEYVAKWAHCFHPEDLPFTISSWKKALLSGEGYKIEHRIKGRDGRFRYFLTHVFPLKSSNSSKFTWFASATDIDSEKQALRELHESEAKFRFMAESIPQIVWTALPNGYEDFHHAKFVEYTGLSQEAALGRGWEQIIHPDDLNKVRITWEKSLTSGEPYSIEYRFRRQDGLYRWFLGRALAMKNKEGEIIKWFGTSTDINDEKEVRLQLEKVVQEAQMTNDELTHVNNILNNFVYMAAHDLRAPVTNLKMMFDLIITEKDLGRRDGLITIIHGAVHRLDNTLKGLVEVINVESVKKAAKEIYLQTVLNNIFLDLIQYQDTFKSAVVADFSLCDKVNYVEAYLSSIFKNLITNSIKYASPERPLQISVRSLKKENFVVIEIEDNGIGIDLEAHRGKLFHPFKRFTHQAEGTGVGLFLVKSIVEKNGGSISVESKIGQGTKFTLSLNEYL